MCATATANFDNEHCKDSKCKGLSTLLHCESPPIARAQHVLFSATRNDTVLLLSSERRSLPATG